MRAAAILVLAALAVAGCGRLPVIGNIGVLPAGGLRGETVEVGGLRFRSRLATTTADGRGFVVTTRRADRGVAAALEAGRLRATKHCLTRFGGSRVAWAVSPDRPAPEVALDADGSLTLSGTCIAR